MLYTLAAAAKATGLSQPTIVAAIEGGLISATRDLLGEWQIERSELDRLYLAAAADHADGNGSRRHADAEAATIEAEIAALLGRTGDGVRQPGDEGYAVPDAPCGQAQPRLAADPQHADLWSPNSDASPSDQAALQRPQHLEFSLSAARETSTSPQATNGASPASDQLAIPLPEGVSAWDTDIRVQNQDKVLGSPSPAGAGRRRTVFVAGAIAAALVLGWFGGSSWHRLCDRATSAPSKQKLDSARNPGPQREIARLDPNEMGREAAAPSNVRKIGAPSATRRTADASNGAAQPATTSTKPVPSPTPATDTSPRSQVAGQQQAKLDPPRVPVPETRPTTIEGWTIREVVGSTAVLQGPNGVVRAARGDTVPGVGRVEFDRALGQPLDRRDQPRSDLDAVKGACCHRRGVADSDKG